MKGGRRKGRREVMKGEKGEVSKMNGCRIRRMACRKKVD